MIKRFQGSEGQRRLIDALLSQDIVLGDRAIADDLAAAAELIQYEANDSTARLITQGDADADIFLILAGEVSIRVHGREVATRRPGQHVGEMTAIDPSTRRSACVVATEQTVVAKFSEAVFSALAEKHPVLWRRLAIEIAQRLRERGNSVLKKHSTPKLFIGSSLEGLPIAMAIHSGFDHDDFLVKSWPHGVFRASSTSIDDLLREVAASDFAILVLTPDDKVICRDAEIEAPRDNCIFELGLFMGALGRERTFIVKPRGADIKIPTDLLGITPLEFRDRGQDYDAASLAPVIAAIRKQVISLGTK